MKKSLIIFFVLIAFGLMSINAFGVQRMVTGELFTNTGCSYCAPADEELDQIMLDHSDILLLVRYHVWWPDGSDPFYQYNTGEVHTRNSYYNNNYAPHFFLDGADRGSGYSSWESYIVSRANVDSPLDISIAGTWNRFNRNASVDVTVDVVNSVPSSNLRIFYGLIENNIHYNAPNGTSIHNQTFRDFLSSASGDAVSYTQGETYQHSTSFTVPGQFDEGNVEFFFFVQNYSTKEILQGARASITDFPSPPDVEIEMIPDNPPVEVQPGGSFTFTGILTNNLDEATITDVWIMLDVPGYGMYGPLQNYENILLTPHQTMTVEGVTQDIPTFAPIGTYNYISYCGNYPSSPIDSSSFNFTVVPPIDGNADGWNLHSWFGCEGDIPSTLSLNDNYPNPFNASTNITFTLPEASNVNLAVYNLAGRKVADLVNGYMGTGSHTITWNAADYSSGVYFYKLVAGDKVITKRATLLK